MSLNNQKTVRKSTRDKTLISIEQSEARKIKLNSKRKSVIPQSHIEENIREKNLNNTEYFELSPETENLNISRKSTDIGKKGKEFSFVSSTDNKNMAEGGAAYEINESLEQAEQDLRKMDELEAKKTTGAIPKVANRNNMVRQLRFNDSNDTQELERQEYEYEDALERERYELKKKELELTEAKLREKRRHVGNDLTTKVQAKTFTKDNYHIFIKEIDLLVKINEDYEQTIIDAVKSKTGHIGTIATNEYRNWETLRNDIINSIIPTESYSSYRESLRSKIQAANESIQAYNEKFANYFTTIQPAMEKDILERNYEEEEKKRIWKRELKQFIAIYAGGIRNLELRTCISQSNEDGKFESLDNAFSMAVRKELDIRMQRKVHMEAEHGNYERRGRGNFRARGRGNYNNMNDRRQHNNARPQQNFYRQSNQNWRGYNRGYQNNNRQNQHQQSGFNNNNSNNNGNNFNNVPQRNASNDRNNNAQTNQNQTQRQAPQENGPRKCFQCGSTQHIKMDCPNRAVRAITNEQKNEESPSCQSVTRRLQNLHF
jgi:hypothetical protein